MLRGQQYMVVKAFDDCSERVTKRDKIDHIAILIERSLDFTTNSIIVSMQALANVARKSDEVGGRKNELLFLKQDSEAGGFHDVFSIPKIRYFLRERWHSREEAPYSNCFLALQREEFVRKGVVASSTSAHA